MNQRMQPSLMVSILCLFGFFFLALIFETAYIVQFDYFFLESVASIRTDRITFVMEAFAFIGSVNTVIVLSIMMLAVFLLMRAPWKEILFTAATLVATGLLNTVIKQMVARGRQKIL
ncbi:hypothetical protein [Bacillus sp. JCM 19041]|uniref:hypothetical protein n=1 Tax=Bacillus sp. JCM 19041 TaxID=1460637 RepID=UPI0006CF5D54